MFSRVNLLDVTPDRMDDVARVVRDIVHPAISNESGYVGYVVLGDRGAGKALGVTLWDSEWEREARDVRAREIRPRLERETGGTMGSVEQFDVLFFDIRTPMPTTGAVPDARTSINPPVTERLVHHAAVVSRTAVENDAEAVRT